MARSGDGACGALCGSSVGRERCRPRTLLRSDVWDGTNVRFGVSQQAAKPTNVRNRNELIRTHTHRVIVRDRSMTHASVECKMWLNYGY